MQTIEEIVKLHSEMEELTLSSGVPKKYYDYIVEFKGDMTPAELEARENWLFRIRHNEYFKVLEIWRLLTPGIWKHYEDLGFQNLREQKLLRERRKALKLVWKQWYRTNYVEEAIVSEKIEANPDGSELQSKGKNDDVSDSFNERPIVLRKQSD